MPFTLNEDAADQVASATTSLSINADAVSKLLEVKVDAVGDDLSEHLDVTRFEQDLEGLTVRDTPDDDEIMEAAVVGVDDLDTMSGME